jgi:ectoine hydroxylase-related dioxygenase (phytanoyl-CoA dioxygenase family)
VSVTGNDHFTIEYEVFNHRPERYKREVEVHANPDDIKSFDETGYLIRHNLFTGEMLDEFRNALDELEARERNVQEFQQLNSKSRNFGGLYLRRLIDKHPFFYNMMRYPPLISVARAMMGPQLRSSSMGRITYPGQENQETEWHQHLSYIPNPKPPWFVQPHGIDILIYLDDLTDETGPIVVLPGSHKNLQDEPPIDYFGEIQGQEKLNLTAGSAVFIHSNLWHRAMPTTPEGTRRRLVIMAYHPVWLRRLQQDGRYMTEEEIAQADPETLELRGHGGFM